jgi:preprotein translocase subunit SecE
MNFLKRALNFLRESKTELKKVKWPTLRETLQYTLVVIIISLVVAAYLGRFRLHFLFSFKKIYYQITCQNKNYQKKGDGM